MAITKLIMASVLLLTLSGCATKGLIPMEAVAAGENQVQVVFEGEEPVWAGDAIAIMTELEQWRGLPFTNDVRVSFQPRTDPRLNGWYNSETKQLVVTTDGSSELGRGVLLHELFHALQDQQFDLSALHAQSLDQPDYDKAVTALIEGEAMLAVSELMNYDFLAHAQLPPEGPISEDFFEKVFLYGAGLKFVRAIREAGGWAAIDAVFQDPPRSTALIFQPERYLAGERESEPIEVPLETGEILQSQTIQGEYELRLMLAKIPEFRTDLDQILDGYVSDTLGIIETPEGKILHRWIIQFDQVDTAIALPDKLKAALIDRVPEATPEVRPEVTDDQQTVTAEW
ncbi:MAG: hypothetical protein AAF152_04365 [Cyanobacteria bacterium P01_A01_bin.114]